MNLVWILFLGAVAIGVAVGYVRGGRLSHVSIPMSAVLLVGLAFAVQATVGRISAVPPSLALAASYSVALICLIVIWRRVRTSEAATLTRFAVVMLVVGTMLNTAVIVSNGGMPVSRRALELAGHAGASVSGGLLPKHLYLTSETNLRALADVMPVPPLRTVVSIGDVFVLFGISAIVAASMIGTRPGGPLRVTEREAV
jgi:Family of unknown function (DUF5317)